MAIVEKTAKKFLKKVKGGEVTIDNCEEYFEKLNEEDAKEKHAELVEKQAIELPLESSVKEKLKKMEGKEKKVGFVEKTGTETKLPVTLSTDISDGYVLETKIGEANLYRFASRMVEAE